MDSWHKQHQYLFLRRDFGSGLLSKIGSGVRLTLQANDCIADTVGLILVSGSIINLNFTGLPDVIASLKVNGVPQPAGIYGGPNASGAPNVLPEFAGSGTVSVVLLQFSETFPAALLLRRVTT